MSDEQVQPDPQDNKDQQEQKFTQAEVDRIVKDRIKRERERFADYDDLKAKATGATTLEERLGTLEAELAQARTSALRATVAARFGVSTEPGEDGGPSDADLFLTGTDEDTLTKQAQRLAKRTPEPKRNHVPREGSNPRPTDDPMRAFARDLFGAAKAQN